MNVNDLFIRTPWDTADTNAAGKWGKLYTLVGFRVANAGDRMLMLYDRLINYR